MFLPGELKMKARLLKPQSITEEKLARIKADFFRERKHSSFTLCRDQELRQVVCWAREVRCKVQIASGPVAALRHIAGQGRHPLVVQLVKNQRTDLSTKRQPQKGTTVNYPANPSSTRKHRRIKGTSRRCERDYTRHRWRGSYNGQNAVPHRPGQAVAESGTARAHQE